MMGVTFHAFRNGETVGSGYDNLRVIDELKGGFIVRYDHAYYELEIEWLKKKLDSLKFSESMKKGLRQEMAEAESAGRTYIYFFVSH